LLGGGVSGGIRTGGGVGGGTGAVGATGGNVGEGTGGTLKLLSFSRNLIQKTLFSFSLSLFQEATFACAPNAKADSQIKLDNRSFIFAKRISFFLF
jgi:hypothetical protein